VTGTWARTRARERIEAIGAAPPGTAAWAAAPSGAAFP